MEVSCEGQDTMVSEVGAYSRMLGCSGVGKGSLVVSGVI